MILPAKIWTCTKPRLVFLGLCFLLTANATAVIKRVIYSFTGAADGTYPAGLISDAVGNLNGVSSSLAVGAHGNLYGTVGTGGDHYKGSVFKHSPNQEGGWTRTDLYSFADGADGAYPSAEQF